MESKNLVICDPETKFASAFAQYLTRQKELAVRVRTCSDLSYVLAIQEKEKIDFLFISSEYPEDSRKQVKAGMVFVIAPEREVALENQEVPIYKYQPGDQILAEMIRQCSMSGDEKQIFLKITGKKNCRVIAVYLHFCKKLLCCFRCSVIIKSCSIDICYLLIKSTLRDM